MKPLAVSALAAAFCVVAISFGGLHLGAQSTPAPIPTPVPPFFPQFPQYLTFGMVGIAPGETARLNALELPGFSNAAQPPCNVTLSFVDDQGNTLKTASMNALQGQAAHLDLAQGEINSATGRVQIRGTVQTTFSGGPLIPVGFGCSVMPTLEIFDDATGVTTTVLESARSVPTVIPLAASTGAVPAP